MRARSRAAPADARATTSPLSIGDWVAGLLPRNLIAAASKGDLLPILLFTAVFALLMILIAVGFAYAKVTNPDVRIIPVVLGIASFILGPMLGVFLLAAFWLLLNGLRKRAGKASGGKGRVAKRSSATRLRRKLGLKPGK